MASVKVQPPVAPQVACHAVTLRATVAGSRGAQNAAPTVAALHCATTRASQFPERSAARAGGAALMARPRIRTAAGHKRRATIMRSSYILVSVLPLSLAGHT